MIFTSLRTRKPVEVPDELVKAHVDQTNKGHLRYRLAADYNGEKFSKYVSYDGYAKFKQDRKEVGSRPRLTGVLNANAESDQFCQPVAPSYEVPISYAPEQQFESKQRFSDFLNDDSPKLDSDYQPTREEWPSAFWVCLGFAFLVIVAALVYIGVKKS